MSDDHDKAAFAVLASLGTNYRRLFFVRAASLQDAYRQVINNDNNSSFQYPSIGFEGFVVGPEELHAVTPDIKAIAKSYWMAALDNASRVCKSDEEDFEAAWNENGPAVLDE